MFYGGSEDATRSTKVNSRAKQAIREDESRGCHAVLSHTCHDVFSSRTGVTGIPGIFLREGSMPFPLVALKIPVSPSSPVSSPIIAPKPSQHVRASTRCSWCYQVLK